jgi:energy-coupling factor transport system permease protein
MTTTPVALVEGLTKLLAPLRRVGLPVDDFALMLLIALRFIPTLVEEADSLMKAQAARGADVTRGSLGERLLSLQSWFVPLVQGALRRAEDLAAALDARGYETQGQRTALHEGPLRLADWLVLAGVVLVTALSLLP